MSTSYRNYSYINMERLYTSFGNKIELKIRMLTTLVLELPKNHRDLKTYLSEGDIDNLKRTIHKLKPSASYLGMDDFKETCGFLENSLRAGDSIDSLEDRLNNALAMLGGAIEELKTELDLLKSEQENG